MARYLKYQTADGDTVLIEAESGPEVPQEGVVKAGRVGERVRDAVEEVQTRFEDAMSVVRTNSEIIIDKVKGLADRPDELEVTFGLKATGELGNFAVAKASAEANYTVKITWKRERERGRMTRIVSRRPHMWRKSSRSRIAGVTG
jgi:hypothetical protein